MLLGLGLGMTGWEYQCGEEFAFTSKRFITPFFEALLTAAAGSNTSALCIDFHVKFLF